jgi:hypothetical protein
MSIDQNKKVVLYERKDWQGAIRPRRMHQASSYPISPYVEGCHTSSSAPTPTTPYCQACQIGG